MEKTDARLLNPTTQNYLRQQAIRLRQQGKRFVDIAEYLGCIATRFQSGGGNISKMGKPL